MKYAVVNKETMKVRFYELDKRPNVNPGKYFVKRIREEVKVLSNNQRRKLKAQIKV